MLNFVLGLNISCTFAYKVFYGYLVKKKVDWGGKQDPVFKEKAANFTFF